MQTLTLGKDKFFYVSLHFTEHSSELKLVKLCCNTIGMTWTQTLELVWATQRSFVEFSDLTKKFLKKATSIDHLI